MGFCYGCRGEGRQSSFSGFPLRVFQNRAVTDKPAGHRCMPGIESNSYLCLIQIATDKLRMSPDKGSKQATACKSGLQPGARVRDEGVRGWVWLHCWGKEGQGTISSCVCEFPGDKTGNIFLHSLICPMMILLNGKASQLYLICYGKCSILIKINSETDTKNKQERKRQREIKK